MFQQIQQKLAARAATIGDNEDEPESLEEHDTLPDDLKVEGILSNEQLNHHHRRHISDLEGFVIEEEQSEELDIPKPKTPVKPQNPESNQTTLPQTKRNDQSIMFNLDHSKASIHDHQKEIFKADDEIQLYIENKYCTVCNIEQPLRTKHCSSCKRCVSTFDHHCPYIGNCVAERNRRLFYFYIWM